MKIVEGRIIRMPEVKVENGEMTEITKYGLGIELEDGSVAIVPVKSIGKVKEEEEVPVKKVKKRDLDEDEDEFDEEDLDEDEDFEEDDIPIKQKGRKKKGSSKFL